MLQQRQLLDNLSFGRLLALLLLAFFLALVT